MNENGDEKCDGEAHQNVFKYYLLLSPLLSIEDATERWKHIYISLFSSYPFVSKSSTFDRHFMKIPVALPYNHNWPMHEVDNVR